MFNKFLSSKGWLKASCINIVLFCFMSFISTPGCIDNEGELVIVEPEHNSSETTDSGGKAILDTTSFNYEIHDANKTHLNLADNLMCWAAAASNVLAWTRWGFLPKQSSANEGVDFKDEIDIFNYFQEHWLPKTGYPQKAWEWWFNGIDQDDVKKKGGGFWDPPHAFKDYYSTLGNIENVLPEIAEYLHKGYGVVIGLTCQSHGHYITCWGYEFEEDDQDQKEYLGIYVTDSDDDSQELRYYELTRSGWAHPTRLFWYFQYYKDSIEFLISEVHALDRCPPPSAPTGLRITSSS